MGNEMGREILEKLLEGRRAERQKLDRKRVKIGLLIFEVDKDIDRYEGALRELDLKKSVKKKGAKRGRSRG